MLNNGEDFLSFTCCHYTTAIASSYTVRFALTYHLLHTTFSTTRFLKLLLAGTLCELLKNDITSTNLFHFTLPPCHEEVGTCTNITSSGDHVHNSTFLHSCNCCLFLKNPKNTAYHWWIGGSPAFHLVNQKINKNFFSPIFYTIFS